VRWIGNSQAVAKSHYLQVTDDHFVAEAKEARNEARQLPEGGGNGEKSAVPATQKPAVLSPVSLRYPQMLANLVGDKGLEPSTSRV
jgi:hypothetical protein